MTGGSRGIGAEIARELAAAGAGVVVCYRRAHAEAEAVAAAVVRFLASAEAGYVTGTSVVVDGGNVLA